MSNFNFTTSDKGVKPFKRKQDFVDYGYFVEKLGRVKGVYEIVNSISKIAYIGSSTDVARRVSKHFSELRLNRHTNQGLQKDFNEIGLSGFVVNVLEHCENNILEREKYHQLERGFDNIYNDKISGEYISDELRKIYANTSKDTHRTQEYRDKMSNLKTKYKVVKIDPKTGNTLETFDSIVSINIKYPNYAVNTIRGVCNGSKKSYDGFYWRYVDEFDNVVLNNRDK